MQDVAWTSGNIDCVPNSKYAILSHDNETGTTVTYLKADGTFTVQSFPVAGVPRWINTTDDGVVIGFSKFIVTHNNSSGETRILYPDMKITGKIVKTNGHILFNDKKGVPHGLCLTDDEIVTCAAEDIAHIVAEMDSVPFCSNNNVIYEFFLAACKLPSSETILYIWRHEIFIDVFTMGGDWWRINTGTMHAKVTGIDVLNIIDVVFIE